MLLHDPKVIKETTILWQNIFILPNCQIFTTAIPRNDACVLNPSASLDCKQIKAPLVALPGFQSLILLLV